MAIEIDSSPQAALKAEPIDDDGPSNKPAAPLADMGMGMGMGLDMNFADSTQPLVSVKEENAASQAAGSIELDVSDAIKTESKPTISKAPVPSMDVNLEGTQSGIEGADDAVLDLTNSDLNFTDMEFTLAPADDAQAGGDGSAGTNNNESSFDLASFDTTDGASGNMSSLDNMLPTSMAEQPVSTTNAVEGAGTESQANDEGEKKERMADTDLGDVFTGDGQADGMDFDFSLGDGMGGDTFDDLMNDRDNTFDTMEHGDFDATFFGLDKIDES